MAPDVEDWSRRERPSAVQAVRLPVSLENSRVNVAPLILCVVLVDESVKG
jgi:hypothetical protein